MERTKMPIKTYSEIVTRAALAARMGMSYGGDRDLYQALGYQLQITYDDYLARYKRQDMAKAIIDRPVKATWQGALQVVESPDPEDTALEAAFCSAKA